MKKLLPLATMEHLMKQSGAHRVSEDAKKELKKILEETAKKITITALKFTLHAGRKTLKATDLQLACEKFKV